MTTTLRFVSPFVLQDIQVFKYDLLGSFVRLQEGR